MKSAQSKMLADIFFRAIFTNFPKYISRELKKETVIYVKIYFQASLFVMYDNID